LRPGEWSGGRFGRRPSREFGGRERPPLHRRRRLIVLIHAIEIAIFAALCYGTGRALTARLPGVGGAVALGVGLCAFAQVLFVVAALGMLTRIAVFVLLAVMALLWTAAAAPPLSKAVWKSGGVAAAVQILPFLRALYPPSAYDETMYHLPYARLFANAGALVYADNLRFPVFPQLNEVVFSAALLVSDDLTAQLTQWLCFVAIAFAIASLVDGPRALFGMAIWFAVPRVNEAASVAHVECGLTLAVTLAFVAWMRWRETEHRGWLFLVGAFAGMAAATKYHGLFFVAFFGIALLALRKFRAIALYVLGVLVVAAPWYIRITALTGNPVFPYFGANDWGLDLSSSLQTADYFHPPELREWIYRNFFINVRPWILALAPFAAIGAYVDKRLRILFIGALSYILVCWRLDSRFLLIVIPLLAVCVASAIPQRVKKTAIVIASIVLLLPVMRWNVRELQREGPLVRTSAQRDAYLARKSWPYAALRAIDPQHSVYVLDGENAAYYARGRFVGNWFGRYRYPLVLPYLQKPDLLAVLLRSFGAQYFVVKPDAGFTPSRAFELVRADQRSLTYRLRE